jgi:hypothetical protein
LSFTKSEQVQFDQGCDKSRQVQVASIKINKSTDLGPDVYLIQGMKSCAVICIKNVPLKGCVVLN